MLIRNSSGEINWNAMAWEAPHHDDLFGYLPTDEAYQPLCEWLKSGAVIWEVKTAHDDLGRGNKVTTKRLTYPGYTHDVIVTYYHDTKMISYLFREKGTYAV